MLTVFVVGFAGTGKSSYVNRNIYGLKCLDLDSSNYSWVETDKGRVRNLNFIKDYERAIDNAFGKYDVVFLSAFKPILRYLEKNYPYFVVVYPNNYDSIYAIERYKNIYHNRGDSEEYVSFMAKNFIEFAEDLAFADTDYKISLGDSTFMEDVLSLNYIQSIKKEIMLDTRFKSYYEEDDFKKAPPRKTLPSYLADWVSGYVEDSHNVIYDEKTMCLIKKLLVNSTYRHLYRGSKIYKDQIPEINSILHFDLVKSWTDDEHVGVKFAKSKQELIVDYCSYDEIPVLFEIEGNIPSFVPLEYCEEDLYWEFLGEREISTCDFKAKVISVQLYEGEDKNHIAPIYHIKLELEETHRTNNILVNYYFKDVSLKHNLDLDDLISALTQEICTASGVEAVGKLFAAALGFKFLGSGVDRFALLDKSIQAVIKVQISCDFDINQTINEINFYKKIKDIDGLGIHLPVIYDYDDNVIIVEYIPYTVIEKYPNAVDRSKAIESVMSKFKEAGIDILSSDIRSLDNLRARDNGDIVVVDLGNMSYKCKQENVDIKQNIDYQPDIDTDYVKTFDKIE